MEEIEKVRYRSRDIFFRDLNTKSNLNYNRHLKFEMQLKQALLKKEQGNRRKRIYNKSVRKMSCGKRIVRLLLLIYPRKRVIFQCTVVNLNIFNLNI